LRYSITDAPAKIPIRFPALLGGLLHDTRRQGKEVRDFSLVFHDGQKLCEALHYSRLPKRS